MLGQFSGCCRPSEYGSLVLSGARPVCQVTPFLTGFCVSQGNSSIPVSMWDARAAQPLLLQPTSRPGMRAPLTNTRARA